MIQLKSWLFVLALIVAASMGCALGLVVAKAEQGPVAACLPITPQPGVLSGKEFKRTAVQNTQRYKEY